MLVFVHTAKKSASGLVILISTYSLTENGFSFLRTTGIGLY